MGEWKLVKEREVGKKAAIALISVLAWLLLLAAVVATSAALSISSLNHVGNSASNIVQELSKNQSAINSLIDEFKKNADPKTSLNIEKNREAINRAIASLGSSKEFQDSIAATINEISQAIISGSSSVKIDFSQIAAQVSAKINAAAKSTVISKKELAKVKPYILDLGKQSRVIKNVHSRVELVLLAWILWLLLLGALFLLKGIKVFRTAGGQLLSIGLSILIIRYVAPWFATRVLEKSDLAVYQRDLIPLIFNTLSKSIIDVSIVLIIAGVILLLVFRAITQKSVKSNNPVLIN